MRWAPALVLLAAAAQGPEPAAAPAPEPRFVHHTELVRALAALAPHGALVNLWATWCAPCVAELPEIQAAADRLAAHGVPSFLVSYDLMFPGRTRANVSPRIAKVLRAKKITLPVFVYDEDDTAKLDELWDLPGPIPVTLALGAGGRVLGRIEGRVEATRLAALGEKLLAAFRRAARAEPPEAFCRRFLRDYSQGGAPALETRFVQGARFAAYGPKENLRLGAARRLLAEASRARERLAAFREEPAGPSEVLRRGPFATVAFPFRLRARTKAGREVETRGDDVFHLVLTEDGWRILSLAWTAR